MNLNLSLRIKSDICIIKEIYKKNNLFVIKFKKNLLILELTINQLEGLLQKKIVLYGSNELIHFEIGIKLKNY